jgi:hypothetical protein
MKSVSLTVLALALLATQSIAADVDCVESTAATSTCTTLGQELYSVTTPAEGAGTACSGVSALCAAGDGSIPYPAIANCLTQATDQCSACDPGFSLASNACADINECATNPCGANGVCSTPVINSYSCVCVTGYSGTNCDVDIDDCASGPCDNGGTCTDGVNSYSCACVTGYSGATCDVDIDDCASGPCDNGGTCTDKVNAYECACADGYSGATCATNIDECAGVDCGGASTCSDGVFEYNCACAAGWEGGGKNTVGDTPSLPTHIRH